MARAARKQASETTSLTPVAGIGDNRKAVVPFTAELVSSFVTSAFDAEDNQGKSKQQANQYMSAAIIGHRALLNEGGAEIDRLVDCLTDDQKRKDMQETMVDKFCDKLPDQNIVGAEAYAVAAGKRVSHMALVRRGVLFAGVLDLIDAKFEHFNSQAGYWNVYAKSLFEKDVTLLGALAQPGAMVLLDNRVYGALGKTKDGKDRLVKVNASIEQVKRIAVPAKARGTGNGSGNGEGKSFTKPIADISIDTLAKEMPRPIVIRILHAQLTSEKPKDIRAASWGMKDTDWGLLADIAQTNDEIQDNEAFRVSLTDMQKKAAQS